MRLFCRLSNLTDNKNQLEELLDNCTYEWTTLNDVSGGKLTSNTNGGSIFLPAAGGRYGSDPHGSGSGGFYRSSTLYPEDVEYAFIMDLDIYTGQTYWYGDIRYLGRSVRPVVITQDDATSHQGGGAGSGTGEGGSNDGSGSGGGRDRD